jgi:apolipoprotein D and lipocalin family protein
MNGGKGVGKGVGRRAGRAPWLTVAALLGIGCATAGPPLEVVESVDLERYLGQWYEIASYPQWFQRGCVASMASYSRREDGRIRVENSCRDERLDGPLRRAEGVAWPADPEGSAARLKVRFFWPFSADYWIIELDPEYRYAVVGHPSRDYLWILSRSPQMDESLYQRLLVRIEGHGYDTGRLQRTLQPPGESG